MQRCRGCYYNLLEEDDSNFDKYGCMQELCVKEMQMFDLDPNEEYFINKNKNDGGASDVHNEMWSCRECEDTRQ